MSNSTLYDDDILLWSEQQAAAIRQLGKVRRGVPNELDIENVAEEIESVGRSELAAVESSVELIFVHLIKLLLEPNADAARHWRADIFAFQSQLKRRYAPSMRQRIDLDALWRSAREQSLLAAPDRARDRIAALPAQSVLTIDDFLSARIDSDAVAERLRSAGA